MYAQLKERLSPDGKTYLFLYEVQEINEMFYRGDKARDRSGSGMGLAIAQRIFSLHHLSCTAENIPGGVRFTLAPDLGKST